MTPLPHHILLCLYGVVRSMSVMNGRPHVTHQTTGREPLPPGCIAARWVDILCQEHVLSLLEPWTYFGGPEHLIHECWACGEGWERMRGDADLLGVQPFPELDGPTYRWRIGLHEAAHAVVAQSVGWHVSGASLGAQQVTGAVVGRSSDGRVSFSYRLTDWTYANAAAVAWAGYHADRRWLAEHPRLGGLGHELEVTAGSSMDLRQLSEHPDHAANADRDRALAHYMAAMWTVNRNWHGIETMADTLVG